MRERRCVPRKAFLSQCGIRFEAHTWSHVGVHVAVKTCQRGIAMGRAVARELLHCFV